MMIMAMLSSSLQMSQLILCALQQQLLLPIQMRWLEKTAALRTTTCKPTADAGQPQTVTEGDKVTLHGSGTGDGALQYLWTQTAGQL